MTMLKQVISHFSKNCHGSLVLPWRTLALSLLATALNAFFGAAPETLVYSRDAASQGEWWRLITGHLVHSDTQHALWDITALLIIGAVSEHLLQKVFFPLLIASALFISTWLWFFIPEITHYCGLSGILHSLLVVGFFRLWQHHNTPEFLIIILLSIAKIIFEITQETAIFTNTAWPALPESHLAGVVFALLYLSFFYLNKPFRFDPPKVGSTIIF